MMRNPQWRSSQSFGTLIIALTILTHLFCLTDLKAVESDAAQKSRSASIQQLQKSWETFLSAPRFTNCQWGALAISLETGETLAEWNADQYFIPASNTKIYTTTLALEELGAEFQIPTRIYIHGEIDTAGVLKGDLLVRGQGDPTYSTGFTGGSWTTPLDPLVTLIKKAGVRKIEGQIIGDSSYFNTHPQGAGWQWDDLTYYYGAEATALSLNDNQLEFAVHPAEKPGDPCRLEWVSTTPYPWMQIKNLTKTLSSGDSSVMLDNDLGSDTWWLQGQLTVDSSPRTIWISPNGAERMFTESLRRALTQQGVETPVASSFINYRERWENPFKESEWKLLGERLSPPVKDIIQPLQKRSQNQYAHMLWLQVGAKRMDSLGKVHPGNLSDRNVSAASESALEDLLVKIGLAPDAVLIEEGSGLSRRHLIRPRATVRLLEWIQSQPYYEDFYKSLPIAAVDGTLRRRLSGTSAEGITRAKTGTLRYAHALSGYTQSKGGEKIAFSFMVNSIQGNYGKIENVSSNPRSEIDHLVQSLSDWTAISVKR